MSGPQAKLLVIEAALEAALHVADGYKARIANLESLLAKKQRQCDKLTDRSERLHRAIRCAHELLRDREPVQARIVLADSIADL